MADTLESMMSTYDIVSEPAVLPETSDAIAPAQSLF